MNQVISSEKLPIKMWLSEIEDEALNQAKNLANLPFAFHHIAIMPDSHVGYGMPIGGVLATDNVIIPNAVGVDIGCGMCAVKTSLSGTIKEEMLKQIMQEIRDVIPVGFNHQKKMESEELMPKYIKGTVPVCEREYLSARKQIGTLGGGNHFIEIQKGNDKHFWIMIHSGSRNLGKQVADYYNKVAKDLNGEWYSNVPVKSDLAFLPINSEEGQSYISEMQYCVEFALANRMLMMQRIKEVFKKVFVEPDSVFGTMINIAHNYASIENHFGRNVWVHRKGATLAREDAIGIIPGSMGTKSYIVQGLGNPESFQSCSHGAGRCMGRNQAIKTLNLETEQKIMEGILGAPRTQQELEEAPSAYKDIDVVMANQQDLVKILVELKPLAVIKG
jgi:tRNA-splicing ligase RtcB